jgi:hypothetical protein
MRARAKIKGRTRKNKKKIEKRARYQLSGVITDEIKVTKRKSKAKKPNPETIAKEALKTSFSMSKSAGTLGLIDLLQTKKKKLLNEQRSLEEQFRKNKTSKLRKKLKKVEDELKGLETIPLP